jgi:hypothetical protein
MPSRYRARGGQTAAARRPGVSPLGPVCGLVLVSAFEPRLRAGCTGPGSPGLGVTVDRMDAAVERTDMYSQRVAEGLRWPKPLRPPAPHRGQENP